MAGLIFLDAYEPTALQALVDAMNTNIMSLRLYQNNYTPVDGSVLGNFTAATFVGYAAVNMFLAVAGEIGGKAVASDGVPRDFTASSGGTPNTIYGYYVVDTTTGVVAWAERFGAPISIASTGDKITIQAQLTLDSANH